MHWKIINVRHSIHILPHLRLLLCAFLLSLLTSYTAWAQTNPESPQVVLLTQETDKIPLGLHMALLEDPNNELDIQTILSDHFSQSHDQNTRFQASKVAIPSLGFQDSTIWARMQLHNQKRDGVWLLEISYALLEYLDLYIVRDNGEYEHLVGGSSQPFFNRSLAYKSPIFEFDLATNERVTLYLQVRSESSLVIPATLWAPEAFAEYASHQLLLLGLYFGLIAAMIVYNLFIFATVRERSYLYYVLFLSFFAVYQLSLHGITQQYIWPEHIPWNNHPVALSAGLAVMFALLFTHSFLDLKHTSPKFYKVGIVLLGIVVAAIITSLFSRYQFAIKIISPLGGLFAIYALFVGAFSMLSGFKPARYFMVAWLLIIFGTLLYSLRAYGILPTNFVTENAMQIGSAMEAMLLSLALAARIRIMKEEQETSQRTVLDNMQRMDHLKNEFLANTSHELRTPINGMIGLAEAILQNREGRLNKEEQQNLAMIISSGRRLSTLVNDILDFSKLQHEDLLISQRPVDLKALSEVVLMLLKPLAQDKQLALVNMLPDNLPLAYADETRLQQVLYNLVGNAIKFTEKGSVQLSAKVEDNKLVICVKDTGPGIPPEHFKSIFESFNQGDGGISRQYGGTGLGLSISRKIIELHQGTLTLNSRLGEGSEFSFTLPLCTQELNTSDNPQILTKNAIDTDALAIESVNSQTAVDVETEPQSVRTRSLGRILVVDDEPVNRQVLRSQLVGVGYSVVEAVDGIQALELLDQNEYFDLVLLDVMMPKLSGYMVCQELRTRWSAEQLPVIFLTARTQSEDVVAALRSGGNDYLSKPFSRDELQARVALHLDLSMRQRDLIKRNAELEALTLENRSLEEISTTDQLTGLKNRRHFDIRYKEEHIRACRTRQPLSLLLIDIDKFKEFNDTYGHLAGDSCLQLVAQTLAESVKRPCDLVCRYGGEEFVALLAYSSLEGATEVAERMRRNIEALEFSVDNKLIKVTISIGVAFTIPEPGDATDKLFLAADNALYKAKEKGRNRVQIAEKPV